MIRLVLTFLVLLAASPALAQDPPAPLPATLAGPGWPVDGDTLFVGAVEVRLWGIDTPERGQRCWLAARAALDSLALDQLVTCDPVERDRYGRVVARCMVDGIDLGTAQLQAGVAVTYRKYLRGADLAPAYLAAERAGALARQGLGCFD